LSRAFPLPPGKRPPVPSGRRVIARKDGNRVKLYSRPGNALTDKAFGSVGTKAVQLKLEKQID
jgi:ATP-dependent DNA ligase